MLKDIVDAQADTYEQESKMSALEVREGRGGGRYQQNLHSTPTATKIGRQRRSEGKIGQRPQD